MSALERAVFSKQISAKNHRPLPSLPPRSRVPLEASTVSQLVKKYPAFYKTKMFITLFTTAHHLYLP
jgi:hypothetical protein